jgi:hypothetical protein
MSDNLDQELLDRELQKSREAAEALAEHNALVEQASKLPALEAEKSRQDAKEQAELKLENEIRIAAPKFAALAERVPVLRARLQEILDSIKPLAEEIRKTQSEIIMAGLPLQAAAGEFDRTHGDERPGMLGNPFNGIPSELMATSFSAALEEVGATNPALDFMPEFGLPQWARELLRAQRAQVFFSPRNGIRNWQRRF